MQEVAKIEKCGVLKKETIPALDSVKWGMEVSVKKAAMAADRRSKAILATMQLAFFFADLTMSLAQGLTLKKNGNILIAKVKPGREWVHRHLNSLNIH